MEQDTDKVRGRDPMRTIHTIAIAAALTMFVTVGLVVISGTSTPAEASSLTTSHAWPVEPADLQVAEKHGRLDHSALRLPGVDAEADPGHAAIANYDR